MQPLSENKTEVRTTLGKLIFKLFFSHCKSLETADAVGEEIQFSSRCFQETRFSICHQIKCFLRTKTVNSNSRHDCLHQFCDKYQKIVTLSFQRWRKTKRKSECFLNINRWFNCAEHFF